MRNIIVVSVASLAILSGCSRSIPDANTVSGSAAGISLKSKLVADFGDNTLKRDQKMGQGAQRHCSKYGKDAVQTIRQKDKRYINATYRCE